MTPSPEYFALTDRRRPVEDYHAPRRWPGYLTVKDERIGLKDRRGLKQMALFAKYSGKERRSTN